MKNEQIQEFFTKVANDESFKEEVLKLKEGMETKKLTEQDVQKFVNKVLLPKAKKLGYNFSEKDLADFGNSQGLASLTELSLDDLENVSGGMFRVFAALGQAIGAVLGFGVPAQQAVVPQDPPAVVQATQGMGAEYEDEEAKAEAGAEEEAEKEEGAEEGAEKKEGAKEGAEKKEGAEEEESKTNKVDVLSRIRALDRQIDECKQKIEKVKDNTQKLIEKRNKNVNNIFVDGHYVNTSSYLKELKSNREKLDSKLTSLERQRQELRLTVDSYFYQPYFSKEYNRAFNMVQEATAGIDKTKILSSYVTRISSQRGENENKSQLTDVEKELDRMVEAGDLPLKSFTIDELSKATGVVRTKGVPTYEYKVGQDALTLGSNSAPNAIIQVASQANALESNSSGFSPVRTWWTKRSQGLRASLDAITAAKFRESAYLQGKLPDALQDMLSGCMVTGATGEPVCILHKYPTLYASGQLRPLVINDIEDLRTLVDWIKAHIGELKVNAQWVLCEDNDQAKLQVFNFAPLFQGTLAIDWTNTNEKTNLYRDICSELVCAQYRALGKIAKIRYQQNGKRQEVHLTQVGQGTFNNPKEVMSDALQAFNEAVQGVDVTVFLHQHSEKDRDERSVATWKDIARLAGVGLAK